MTMFHWITAGSELFLMIFICLGNSLVFMAFYQNLQLRTITNYYILQLAIADFCVGINMALHALMYVYQDIWKNIAICLISYTTLGTLLLASGYCLIAITYDRYMALIYPLRYHQILTKTRCLVTSGLIWGAAFLLGFVLPIIINVHIRTSDLCDFTNMMTPWYLRVMGFPGFSVGALIMIYMYSRIFYIAGKHARKIRSEVSTFHENHNSLMKSNLRMTKTALIVLGTFYGCWTPLFLVIAIQVYRDKVDLYNKTLNNIRVFTTLLAVLNSGINPIIYAARIASFRLEFKRILRMKIEPHEQITDISC